MPRLSVWLVRASFIHLMLGLLCGALILAEKGVPFYAPVWHLFPLHMEFLLIGWLIQLAMGVAFWIVPRFSRGASRGPETLVWLSWALLNAGILSAAFQFWFPVMLVVGRILEVVACILFIVGSWRRIKPHGI
ncbi:MAG: hypothetical protein DCC59_00640 [Chloroflexi bacterium]|nr:hypothetical protein [Chloroflexi bacterium CFX1]MCK6566956.1 cbb3-type cytochrome c oxidase subunit I [Anaerolineales bacterium]MCQ3951940.1 hypothetical protein [Chloroflexota bacterium]MDL1919642.1 cbb3-type cytochrome c oxidase subunit I [Chloroflexi bacterium CFX5]NUQ58726.1 hypothetical protein [Anaerolineales bacterium]